MQIESNLKLAIKTSYKRFNYKIADKMCTTYCTYYKRQKQDLPQSKSFVNVCNKIKIKLKNFAYSEIISKSTYDLKTFKNIEQNLLRSFIKKNK